MFISYQLSAAEGFKRWSARQTKFSNDNDQPGGSTPMAVADPPTRRKLGANPEQ
jgi:hypothetical protein